MTKDEARPLVLRRLKQYCPAAPDIIPDTTPIAEFTNRMGVLRTWLCLNGFFYQAFHHDIGEVVRMLETRSVETVGDLVAIVAEINTFLSGIPNLEDWNK